MSQEERVATTRGQTGAGSTTDAWHAHSIAAVVGALATNERAGLPSGEAAARLAHHGQNLPEPPREEPWWEEVVESLTEPLVLLLLAVAALYFLLGELADAITILGVILAVAAVEVVTEARAKRAIASLRALSAPTAVVVRGGALAPVPSADVVPGDLVMLRPGDRIPADLRLVEATALRIDESALTGEAVPAGKRADAELPPDTELGDRRNCAFAGTLVVAGKGAGIAVATGRSTVVAKIGALAASTREPRTPLQEQMRQLAGWLLWLAVAFSVLVPVLGVLIAGRPWQEMVLTGLTLAFATIPEELPILITIVLGLGAYQLARQHAVVKRLRAAETLGGVSTVGTDKTGTLTENRMRVAEVVAEDRVWTVAGGVADGLAHRLLEIGVLANDAQAHGLDGRVAFVGDPTETALLEAAEAVGIGVIALRDACRELEEFPFDDVRKRMSAVYEREGKRWLVLKGSPESVLGVCERAHRGEAAEPLTDERRAQIQATVEAMAARGLRVLAFAERRFDQGAPPPADTNAEDKMTFVGLAGLEDPPRPQAPAAVAELQAAGVRVVMLTGDHPATAQAISRRVGIDAGLVVRGRDLDATPDQALPELVATRSVFARITPEHKLRIVRALQAQGEVVAVTGDGVNDTPALREAAIGVAMGRGGTEAAREAADLVLQDDNFATVTAAVRAGRLLYANLRKAVRYYLAAKVGLVTASLGAVLMQLPVPFAPVQIIVLELFMDLGASTTFVAEQSEEDLMARPPRDSRAPFMDRAMKLGIMGGGLSLAVAVLVPYLWTWRAGLGVDAARTAAFAAWMVGHVALAAHMRAERQPLLRTSPRSNPVFLVWAGAALGLLLVGASVPFAQDRLHLAALPLTGWALAVGAGLAAPAWWEVTKWTRRPRRAVPAERGSRQ